MYISDSLDFLRSTALISQDSGDNRIFHVVDGVVEVFATLFHQGSMLISMYPGTFELITVLCRQLE